MTDDDNLLMDAINLKLNRWWKQINSSSWFFEDFSNFYPNNAKKIFNDYLLL